MKHIIVASLLLSSAAFAQSPPAKPVEPLPITLDAQTYTAIMTFLQDVPLKHAGPIHATLERAQVEARMKADMAERAKANPKPAESK